MARRSTHLQRAFKIFEQLSPQLLSARQLAALMHISVETAYHYTKRLKNLKCIEPKGGSGKIPLYGLVLDAKAPADDARGRKRKDSPGADHDEVLAAS